MSEREKVLLYSGGLDSHLLWLHEGKPERVMFYLGDSAAMLIRAPVEGVSRTIRLPQLGKDGNGFVPYRNLLFIMLATATDGRRLEVLIGQTLEWQVDKNAGFYRDARRIARQYGRMDVVIRAPFAGLTKTQMVAQALREHVDPSEITRTHSCLRNYARHCGRCSSCIARWIGLKNNGLVDETFEHVPTLNDYYENARRQRYLFSLGRLPMYMVRHMEAMRALNTGGSA